MIQASTNISLHKSPNRKGLQLVFSVNPLILMVRPARFELATYGFVALLFGTVGIHRDIQGYIPFSFLGYPGICRDMGGYFFQFVDQMLTKNRILGLFKISKFTA